MRYQFPIITHLNDVLPAIEGRDEFIVVQKDGYQIVNYAVVMEDTFPPVETAGGSAKMRAAQSLLKAIRRECRGLVFDMDGKIIGRRYHKFFNANEREETRMEKIDWFKPHRILEKLDGSMISPIPVKGAIRWTTKMGITDTSMQAEEFVAKNPNYVLLAEEAIAHAMTPIFEWTSRQQRIVIDYEKDNLILTAVRDNILGTYVSYEDLLEWGKLYNIDVVVAHEINEDLITAIQKWEGAEGIVVRFNDGHMVKIKSEWYVLRHKSKDAITREKNVLEYIVNDRVDDVLPFLEENDQKQIIKFRDEFWDGLGLEAARLTRYVDSIYKMGMDKKRWAIEIMPAFREQQNAATTGLVFSIFDGKDARDVIVDHIRKNINTQTKVEAVRYLWGGAKWSYNFDGDV